METALMKLIKYCDSQMEKLNEANTLERVLRLSFFDIREEAKSLLPYEKEVMENTFKAAREFQNRKFSGGGSTGEMKPDYMAMTYKFDDFDTFYNQLNK